MLGGSGGAVVRVAMPICQSSAPPAAAVSAGCSFAFAGRKPIPKFTYSVRPIHPFSGLSSSQSSQLALSLSRQMLKKIQTYYAPIYPQIATAAASSSSSTSAGSVEYVKEPATNVKFQRALNVPGCSASLSLVGNGYREKVFAIIGVKVYAAGLYVNPAILSELNSWKGWSSDEIEGDLSLFNSIYQSHLEKSLQITLVRDVDGKTFWDALDEAVSPRIKAPSSTSESALSTFRSVFWGQSLKKGTLIFLTWLEPSKMLVSVLSDGVPTGVEATVESKDVTKALFDVFWGDSPVSPSLKSSVAAGLAAAL